MLRPAVLVVLSRVWIRPSDQESNVLRLMSTVTNNGLNGQPGLFQITNALEEAGLRGVWPVPRTNLKSSAEGSCVIITSVLVLLLVRAPMAAEDRPENVRS